MAAGPTIGVLAPLLAGEYFGALISGIRGAVAERHGRVIAIQTMDTRLGDIRDTVIAESDLAAKVAWEHIDGFVALVGAVGPAYLHAIGATGKPLVTVSQQFPGLECPVVGPDNRIGTSAAVSHLLAHGHTRIAFAGHLGQLDINERYEAYQDTLRAHGIEPDPRFFYATSNNHEGGGERAAKAMLAAGLPSTAVMVATDFNALGLIQMLIAAGAELPRDQAIIAFDNTRMGAQLRPTLSSVSQHFAHTGAQAARLVFDKLVGLHVAAGRHPVATSLVVRESCGCSSSELRGEPAEGGLEGARHRFLANLLGASGAGGNEPTQRLVGSLTDVTDRKELEDRLRQDALYDGLTGLPNRVLFLDRLERAITHSRRRADYNFVVLFLDLDGFKPVNDTLGHLAGDNLLKGVAARISGQLRESDTAARFGGDEFAVLLNDVADLDDVPVIVSRLQAALAEPYELDESVVVVSASIGIATSATGYEFPEDVLRDSDIAMYRAKAAERGTYATFDVSMHQRAVTRMRLESDLRQAVERREFELYYQPIYALGTHRIHALEALVRWRHPERGIISPGEFLPVAEETGLMVSLGALIIEEVCRQRAQWAADGAPMDDVRISVNISNREFWHANFQPHLEASLEAYDVLPAWLNLEITEGVIMHNPDAAQSILSDLRRWGFELHIDDFGTGYSSLDALHRFPVEALKIDRSFVARLETDARSRELVRTITMMGRSLDMEVIAEGIETVAQEGILSDLGCESGQGYLFSRPVPAAEVEALLVRSRAGAGPPVAARRH